MTNDQHQLNHRELIDAVNSLITTGQDIVRLLAVLAIRLEKLNPDLWEMDDISNDVLLVAYEHGTIG